MFINKSNNDILFVHIYVDDIIFGTTNEDLYQEFVQCIQQEFEMSMMGELTFFFGFQIKQMNDGIFINQEKYTKELLKRFSMEKSKPSRTLMSTSTKLDNDENSKSVD